MGLKRYVVGCVVALLVGQSGWSATFASGDDSFLALRDAALRGDARQADIYARRLAHYDIPSYVEYYRLLAGFKTAPDAEIRDFLQQYKGTAIADRLRNDWLLRLGQRGEWQTFDEQYPQFVLNDDTQVKCYALISAAIKGDNVVAEAQRLLTTPKDYGAPCVALIGFLAPKGQFDRNDVWTQVFQAGESGVPSVVQKLAPVVGAPARETEQAYDHPMLVLTRGVRASSVARELFILALARLARTDSDRAVKILREQEKHLSPVERRTAWAQIAYQAALSLSPDAMTYWRAAEGANFSSSALQWRARSALRAGDWTDVRKSIMAMPEWLREEPAWVYWLAQVEQLDGHEQEALKLLGTIANQTHFYGQLAQENLGKLVSIPQAAAPVTPRELDAVADNPGFQRALRFLALGLRFEAVREWNWQLRSMNDRRHLAAAEFAREKGLLDRMINTSDRTRSEFDFNQRFPMPFRNYVVSASEKLGLDIAWMYGLMRQESRFVTYAKSSVGASGVMQLMPGTAHWVAKKIGMEDYGSHRIHNLDDNITLGSNYLNMVLAKLDHSEILATAAYNAGPRRSIAWRTTLTRTVPGAVFVETIPFSETRQYVKNVMLNTTYYAALLDNKPQSLLARLGTVSPAKVESVDLP